MRDLLAGELWSSSSYVGPILDLLLDPDTHEPRVLVVRHHLATDDEEQMFIDLCTSRHLRLQVDPEACRFTCEEISEILATND